MRSPRATLGRRLHQWVWGCPDDAEFARRFAIANRRWRIPIQLEFDEALRVFRVSDSGNQIAVSRRSRLSLYFTGMSAREDQLVRDYLLARIPFESGDRIVDVGANIGEVSQLLARRYGVIPTAFEPEDREFQALEENLRQTDGSAHNELLWSHRTELTFHDANDSGDSSIFHTSQAKSSRRRTTTTLDAAIEETAASRGAIRLLKLEAEGAEPEVLAGATETLGRTQFVTADVGPERGPEQKTTLIPVYEHLRDSGFEAVDVTAKRLSILFKKSSFTG